MRAAFLALALLLPQSLLVPALPQTPAALALETGKILPHVQCAARPEQSYALYLPSNYSPDRKWPLILSSDPAARGSVPLELQKEAAEKWGYMLAASNNSRNGPWKPRFEATEATFADVQTRVSIDPHRIYLAGFSGAAAPRRKSPCSASARQACFWQARGFQTASPSRPMLHFPSIPQLECWTSTTAK